jgi:histidine ammonia-lyase
LNPYLSPKPGLHSGLMIAQYTAAALCNELQTLSAPASIHNIPTSAGMEDYNSMGVTAAHQAWRAVDLARNVIAIELLCASEALEYQRPLQSGDRLERAHGIIREHVPRLVADRPPHPDIVKLVELIKQGVLVN